ncbi:MAG: chromate transporter [Heliobacteriaceae bacterium]|jgi:chromate transporter|nr:chromate transporter [Heliobacteriaceae bacterium]
MTIYDIFKTFFKMGIILFGGGFVILPAAQAELAEKKQWLTHEEICEFYALARSVPGIVAPNFSVFAGYKLKKIKGAIAALTGLIMPAFLSIVILAEIFEAVIHMKFVRSMFWGIGIGVVMLIFLSVKEMWENSVTEKLSFALFFAAFVLSACFKVSPSAIILTAAALGIALQLKNESSKANGEETE